MTYPTDPGSLHDHERLGREAESPTTSLTFSVVPGFDAAVVPPP